MRLVGPDRGEKDAQRHLPEPNAGSGGFTAKPTGSVAESKVLLVFHVQGTQYKSQFRVV